MQHQDKVELIELLRAFKQELPPVEERKFLTNHYAKLEKRIEEAISKIKDKDYQHLQQVNAKLLELQLQDKITHQEYIKLVSVEAE